jgi:NADPH:quinone reductase-like Zn-dependent oxidoreductase
VNLTYEQAAAVPSAAIMALQGLRGRRIEPGQHVLINGAGGNVGPFAVQIAKSFGAEVTGVDSTGKLDLLRSVGADHVIDYTQEDYLRSGQRYDRILDVVANHPILECKRALRPKGTYLMVVDTPARMFQGMLLGPLVSIAGSRKMGMLMWQPFKKEDVVTLTELIEAGGVTPVIDRTYPLSEVPESLRYQEEGHPRGKIVITV